MIDRDITHPWPPEVLEAVSRFKQGDLVEHPPFFYAACGRHGVWQFTRDVGDPTLDSELIEIDPEDVPSYGLITTQTCDIDEQRTNPRQPWFMVAPVYAASNLVDSSQINQLKRGQIGHLVLLDPPDLPPGLWVADLRIEMPLEKSWLVEREPISAFPDEAGYLGLAHRLARRRDRPALANAVSIAVVGSLRRRLDRLAKARRDDLLDDVYELRLFVVGTRTKPSAARLLIIVRTAPPLESVRTWFDAWWDDARKGCEDHGLALMSNRYETLGSMSAEDYISSIPLNFEYLSPEED